MKKAIASNIGAKSTWKFINWVFNKNKKYVVHSVNNNSGISLSGINMSNYFNDFFVDTIPNMIKNRPILNVVTQNPFNLVKNNRDSFFLYPMTAYKVQNYIKKLKNKSCKLIIKGAVGKGLSMPFFNVYKFLNNYIIQAQTCVTRHYCS